MNMFWQTPIVYLKGVGPAKAEVFSKELGIVTHGDLLQHFPFRHVDRSRIWKINELNDELPFIQIKGKIYEMKFEGAGKAKRLLAKVSDGSGVIELVWFKGVQWVQQTIKSGKEYIIFGKPSIFKNIYNIVHPELSDPADAMVQAGVQPIYSTTEKMKARFIDSKTISKLILNLIQMPDFSVQENLPDYIIKEQKLLSRKEAFIQIHFPKNAELSVAANNRIKFEELLFLQLSILRRKQNMHQKKTDVLFLKVGNFFNSFYNERLEFQLTNAQKRVMKEIREDARSGKQMNRLLQGDVGSGKTIVALMMMLLAADNNYQSSLMAPTEILAQQHYKNISDLLYGSGVGVELLTGSTTSATSKKILSRIENNESQILIGTHALIEDRVKFKNLGLVVIDEQHRFGVEQRYKLWQKNNSLPHVLVMTATPIPRTLAMTVYGDLDCSVIDELPVGRKPIRTVHRYERQTSDIYNFIKDEIKKGRQIYIVYPLIEESEKLDYQNLMEGYEYLRQIFTEPEYRMGMLHGRMKPKEKDIVMNGFVKGETNLLISTTVIEVGVNVPNASVMMIMNVERFGLSQLHQLRGRVGRGAEQSFCILVSGDKLSADARKRIATLVETNDGFKIAEVDMELRGPGDIDGTRQSGLLNLKLASITEDRDLIECTRNIAIQILQNDPNLSLPENFAIYNHLKEQRMIYGDWSRVS